METQIVKTETGLQMGEQLNMQFKMAKLLVESNLLPKGIDTPEKAFLLIQQGKELGLQPMQSINNVYVVDNKTAISSAMMSALLRQSGQVTFEIKEWTDKVCTITFTRKEEKPVNITFTIDDAQKMGLTGKYNWKNMPKQMLYARCLSKGARIIGSDIIQGLYTKEELEDISDTPIKETEVIRVVTPEEKAEAKEENKVETAISEVITALLEQIATATHMRDLEKIDRIITKNIEMEIITNEDAEKLRYEIEEKANNLKGATSNE